MMGDIIHLLPDSIANQIAAGEVVQRPASVVKELLENSIDAGSQSITLLVKEAGKTLVQVIDDGSGMSETDARMSFERHATSKIRKSEDLFKIQTMGFRGEALASIAAVAQVELKTKRSQDELGCKICIEASKLKSQETVACSIGTSLSVKNLFFNVPARRNFLKSNPVEMRHILDEFHRVALAHPQIEFSLFHNDLEVYHLMPGKLSQRIIAIFGKNYQKQMASCEEATPLMKIKGYIGRPENSKKSKGQQFFFVNKRYIRHAYLHHAVLTAFEGLIPADSFPFYVLFLEIDPVHIDINIHPTKTEVKFDDERSIYAIVQAAVRKSLSVHNLSPALDFEVDVNIASNTLHFKTAIEENPLYQGTGSSGGTKSYMPNYTPKSQNPQDWESFYENLKKNTPEENPAFEPEHSPELLTFPSKANQISGKGLFEEDTQIRRNFQIHNQFIISQVQSGILLIHQKAAQERILFDKYLQNLQKKTGLSQRLLFPVEIELNPSDFQLILEIEIEIRNLGFIFDVLPKNSILLKGVPTEAIHENEHELFEGFLEQFKNYQSQLSMDKHTLLARSLSKRATQRLRKALNNLEINALIDQLFASTNPNFAPDGHPCFVKLSLDELSAFFVN
ncbi:MAG: DNA mismatch repair endonuclease MutL [Microscillaceae bacterium]|nr:DNA mismatch repair endonuclease MutL [Microscillaceae bacterium]